MFGLFEKLNDPEHAHHERLAFVAALVLTAAIGTAWFYFVRPTEEGVPPVALSAAGEAPVASTSAVEDIAGPFSNIRAQMGDAAVFIAAQVRKIGDIWKGWSFGKPVEYQRQEE